ncbi:hypothetical protein MASR1M8_26480 [Thermomonas brevis]
MNTLHKAVLAGFLVAAIPFALAAADTPAQTIDAGATFRIQRDAIVQALDDGKTYAEIRKGDKDRVRELLKRIEAILGEKTRIDELSADAKVQAFNAQQEINTVLTRAHGDSRLICERVQTVGTHRRTTSCMTVAERRRAREASQEIIKQNSGLEPHESF